MKYFSTLLLGLLFVSCVNKSIADDEYTPTEFEYVDNTNIDADRGGYICTSEDGRISIESVMQPHDGTSPDFWSYWTIVDDNGKKQTFKEQGETPFHHYVHPITKNDGSVYYLVSCYYKASSADAYEWLRAYKIVGDKIKEVNVVDGSDNISEQNFEVNYSIPDCYFLTNGAGFNWILEYDANSQNLYVANIEDGVMLDRYDVWHFNGERFVNMGQQPHKNLHKSLSKYNRLIYYATTKDYIVRVDSITNLGLRYASWKKPKTMADEPDIIIHGGKKRVHPATETERGRCDDYHFANDDYEYIVNYCELGDGEHYDHLLIRKNGRVILKQEVDK